MYRYAPIPASDSPYSDEDQDEKFDFPPSPTGVFLPSRQSLQERDREKPTEEVRRRVRRALLACALCLLLLAAAYNIAPRWGQILEQQDEVSLPAELALAGNASARPAATPSSCTNAPSTIHTSNVNPNPRPPPPCTSKEERYLTYENHSGFYNQLSSLTNALWLAEYLNRTLLLPPARLGVAAAWKPDLRSTLEVHEHCKALAVRKKITDAQRLPEECREPHADPSGWTYVGWDAIFKREWLAQWDIVDRWNVSQAWLELSREKGGMGLHKRDTYSFEVQDVVRSSYQFYETREQPPYYRGGWGERIDLPDLAELPKYRDKKLLHFGSLFGDGRIDLGRSHRPSSWLRREAIQHGPVLGDERLARIAGEIRARVGSYVGVHLRMGDGAFKTKARTTFPKIFEEIAVDFLGVEEDEVRKLLAASEVTSNKMGHRTAALRRRHAHGGDDMRQRRVRRWESEDEGDEEVDELWFQPPEPLEVEVASEGETHLLSKRAFRNFTQDFWPTPEGYTRPMSDSVTCRGELYPDSSPLYALNQPVYIATDARSPSQEAAMVPFLQHFPCLFFLSDFGFKSSINGGETIKELEGMFAGETRSEWDGQAIDGKLMGFLDAMLAAGGDAMVGTPSSSFSAYAFDLHQHYVEEWLREGSAVGAD